MATLRYPYLIFDLGGTLMHARGAWEPVHRDADLALVGKLGEFGIRVDSRAFRDRLHEYYAARDHDYQETTYHFVLREHLGRLGHEEVPEGIIRTALDALYAVTQRNWVLEEDALDTLRIIKGAGYHLGLLSNAGDDRDVQQLIDSFGIRPFFEFVLTSARCFYRKPHPRAFELALAHWNAPPQEGVMVGDSLEADIQGGRQANLKTVWITRRAVFTDEEFRRIQPDFSIRRLKELPAVLERMTADPAR